ncbi:hypothetical protein KQ41_21875 [Lysinibacillus fusiformis]|uniref:hypothetical protein n=1 Tax=Lysinibacillus fusiformis TaxID=28031 RepID=UPI0005062F3D|nr:hypothetical protein [Lysinibacillus fusiformis]KGA81438.1 hypothetical protein KQ41_21875 [Lysinibacillus fusiformis]
MEKKWNEEVTELLVDVNDLITAEKSGSENIINLLYTWIEDYFDQKNFDGSFVLNYTKTSAKDIRIIVLQKKLIMSVDAFADIIKIDTIVNGREYNRIDDFSIGTFKNGKSLILSRKVLFDILDKFTKEAIENYTTERIYL